MDLGVPDFREEPLGWRHLSLVVEQGRLELLGRSRAQQQGYRAFAAELGREWASTADFLLCAKLGLPHSLDEQGRKQAVRPADLRLLRLLSNDFPYHFEAGIEHFVLWKCGPEPLTSDEIEEARQRMLEEGFAETLFYVNPPHLKSILDIDNAHLIARRD